MGSPAFFFQVRIVPCSIVRPNLGMVTSVAIAALSLSSSVTAGWPYQQPTSRYVFIMENPPPHSNRTGVDAHALIDIPGGIGIPLSSSIGGLSQEW